MRKIAIHGRKISEDSLSYVREIIQILQEHKRSISISPDLAQIATSREIFKEYPQYEPGNDMSEFEAILSLGGDGTLLDTLAHVGQSELPILGINLGRLGFLAVISKDNIFGALTSFFKGEYTFDNRALLYLESGEDLFEKKNFGLNEFAILRKDSSSMIVVDCFLDGEFLNTYWADGLIVATPTGSTGYSLSCGGPVIMPNTKNFIITPISPHNLNVRPLIIPEDSELVLKISASDQSYQISFDSRSIPLEVQKSFTIKKAPFSARLVKITGTTFLDTLRNKLTWGLDKRN